MISQLINLKFFLFQIPNKDSLPNNNLSTHVWTVDDVKSASEYLKIGIDSITTNRPLYLRNELENLQ